MCTLLTDWCLIQFWYLDYHTPDLEWLSMHIGKLLNSEENDCWVADAHASLQILIMVINVPQTSVISDRRDRNFHPICPKFDIIDDKQNLTIRTKKYVQNPIYRCLLYLRFTIVLDLVTVETSAGTPLLLSCLVKLHVSHPLIVDPPLYIRLCVNFECSHPHINVYCQSVPTFTPRNGKEVHSDFESEICVVVIVWTHLHFLYQLRFQAAVS